MSATLKGPLIRAAAVKTLRQAPRLAGSGWSQLVLTTYVASAFGRAVGSNTRSASADSKESAPRISS
jgi:hypothetical protein